MSADNWARCPRCEYRRQIRINDLEENVRQAYGKVSVQEFDAMRNEVESLIKNEPDRNFREDYEIYGAEDGVINIGYSGHCSICDLTMKINRSDPIPGVQS